jgi:predicted dehydrogenase
VLSYAHIGHALSYSAALEKIPGVELAAIYDEDVERGEQFAGQFGARFYATVAELLDQKSINAVSSLLLPINIVIWSARGAGRKTYFM